MNKKILPIILTIFCGIFFSCDKDDPVLFELKIQLNPSGAGDVNISKDTLIERGERLTLIASSEPEYIFESWEGSINSTDNPLNFEMEEDVSLIAYFIKRKYALNIETVGQGTVTESVVKSKTDYDSGTHVKLVATPETGWAFAGWSGDADSMNDTLVIVMNQQKNITAEFRELVTYCVPKELRGYDHKENGDSLLFLEYQFDYQDQFLVAYSKRIDYQKTNEYPFTVVDVEVEYQGGKIRSVDHRWDSGVKNEHQYEWNGMELTELRYLHTQSNGTETFKTEKIEYSSECGISEFDGINIQNSDGAVDTSYYFVDFNYENNCLTNGNSISNKKTTYEETPSIFSDLKGMNGLFGASYTALFSEGGIVPGLNKNNLRIESESYRVYRNRNWVSEQKKYTYKSFLDDNLYPQYFILEYSDENDEVMEMNSFTVSYQCSETF